MKMMKRCIAAILLLLSLEALIAGRLSAAIADDGVDTIRLPSQGQDLADELAAREKGDEKKMPWKCCDVTECTRSIPPACRCMDPVERCNDACKSCVVSKTDPSKHVCADRYREGAPSRPAGNGRVSMEKSAANGEEAARPWTCCDDTLCTRSAPPTCQCLDKVKKCAKTCKSCDKADKSNGASSSRYVCLDRYFGWPGPKCNSGAAGVRLGDN